MENHLIFVDGKLSDSDKFQISIAKASVLYDNVMIL